MTGDPISALGAQLTAFTRRHENLAAAWLIGYSNAKTRAGYEVCIRKWFSFADRMSFDPLDCRRAHVDLWQREAELEGLKPRTIQHRLVAINSFYEYLVDEELIERSPMRGVKRPRIARVSPTAWLNRTQLADLIDGARALGPYPYATIVLLGLTGVRINEACTANADGLHEVRFYPCLWVHRKGGFDQRVKLPIPVYAALREALDGRTTGPLLLTRTGTRMSQSAAQRIIDRALRSVRGDHGRITPHALRHSWISAGVSAGASLQQLAEDAGHADTRMIPYYTHSDDHPAKSANHVIAGHVMST